MGSNCEDVGNEGYRENQRKLKPSLVIIILFLLSMLISFTGGYVLAWWIHKYRSENRELWMVPFGLILFLTPLFIWFSLIVSDICGYNYSKEDEEKVIPRRNHHQLVHPTDDSVWNQMDDQKM